MQCWSATLWTCLFGSRKLFVFNNTRKVHDTRNLKTKGDGKEVVNREEEELFLSKGLFER